MENDKNLFPFEQAYPFLFSKCIEYYEATYKLDFNSQSVTILSHCASLLSSEIKVFSHGIPQKPILWSCVIQESGTAKSAVLKRHCKFLQERNLELEQQEITYECTDATYEAIVKFSTDNTKGIMFRLDELETWVKGMDSYSSSGNKGKYNEVWNGEPMVIIRTGIGKTIVKDNKVIIASFTQPKMIKQLLQSNDFANGFAYRFLFASVYDSKFRYRNNKKIEDRHARDLEPVYEKIWKIKPMDFIFSQSADKEYTKWYNEFADRYKQFDSLRAYIPKLETYGLRIACVLHCMEWATTGETDTPEVEISADTIQRTTLILEFFMIQFSQMLDYRLNDNTGEILNEQRMEFQKVYKNLSDVQKYKRDELMKLFVNTYKQRQLNTKFLDTRLFNHSGNVYTKAITNE